MTTAQAELVQQKLKTKPISIKRGQTYRRKDILWGYLMITPLFIGLLIFYIWPTFQTFYFSFTKWDDFGKYKLAGLVNYQQMLHDTELGQSLINTIIFTVVSVPCCIAISILIAVMLNQKIRGVGVYRTLYFLPAVTMPAAIALVWKWLYNGDYGLINDFLALFHVQGPRWVADPRFALTSLIIVAIWSGIGNNMILFLAGLQSIPSTYYEAATIDGAGPVTRFFRITLPLLSPTVFFSTVISLINALQIFDLIYLMFGGSGVAGVSTNSAIDSVQTIVYLFYKSAFLINNKGYAAGIAVLLFVIILVITAIQLRLQKRWVHYS